MPGSFPTSSVCTLHLLLLPLLVSFHRASSATLSPPPQPCKAETDEFNKDVNTLRNSLETCPDDCSLAPTNDQTCQCLHISMNMSHVPACRCLNNRNLTHGCAFLNYFKAGLETLRSRNLDSERVDDLIIRLGDIPRECHEKVSCPETGERVISPLNFLEKLKNLVALYSVASSGAGSR